jgi:hypothetical protein
MSTNIAYPLEIVVSNLSQLSISKLHLVCQMTIIKHAYRGEGSGINVYVIPLGTFKKMQ